MEPKSRRNELLAAWGKDHWCRLPAAKARLEVGLGTDLQQHPRDKIINGAVGYHLSLIAFFSIILGLDLKAMGSLRRHCL